MAAIALTELKIGRTAYQVKSGDYIMYNGSMYLYCAGDKRVLKQDGFTSHSHLVMPASLVKKIPFIRMTKIEYIKEGINFVKWYF